MKLHKKHIVITGGANGIGYALSVVAVVAGARVTVVDLKSPEQPVRGVRYVRANLADSASIRRAIGRIAKPVHVLVNNAGVMRRGTLFDATEEEWDLLMAIHLKAQWLLVKGLEKKLARSAVIVNISSRHALHPPVDPAVYGIAKAAVLVFSEILQKTKPLWRVKVACLGRVDTALHRHGATDKQLAREWRLGLVCSPEDIVQKLIRLIESSKPRLLFDTDTCSYRLGS